MSKIDEARAAIATAQQRLEEAKELLKKEEEVKLDPRDYVVGFFDDLEQLRRVWAVYVNYDCDLVREDFTYQSVKDHDGGYWYNGSDAGLFNALLNYSPSDVYTVIGFRCAQGHITITPQKFLEMFEEEM